jgi:hypothetical protein
MSKYQLHERKTWPFKVRRRFYYTFEEAIEQAIVLKVRFVSKDGMLHWTNPFALNRRNKK